MATIEEQNFAKEVAKQEANVRFMFRALADHFFNGAYHGRGKRWCDAARSYIDLVESGLPEKPHAAIDAALNPAGEDVK